MKGLVHRRVCGRTLHSGTSGQSRTQGMRCTLPSAENSLPVHALSWPWIFVGSDIQTWAGKRMFWGSCACNQVRTIFGEYGSTFLRGPIWNGVRRHAASGTTGTPSMRFPYNMAWWRGDHQRYVVCGVTCQPVSTPNGRADSRTHIRRRRWEASCGMASSWSQEAADARVLVR